MKPMAVFAVLTLVLVAGCRDTNTGRDTTAAPPAASAVQAPPTDQWLGQWTGPEGTFLRIEGGQGTYRITVQNLDGPRTFPATAAGDRIQFERDGVSEAIRATNGADTGMKWLSDKSSCLTVRPGEGYCRD